MPSPPSPILVSPDRGKDRYSTSRVRQQGNTSSQTRQTGNTTFLNHFEQHPTLANLLTGVVGSTGTPVLLRQLTKHAKALPGLPAF
jgi:hypothetical protein